ncbi:MAG: 3-oxoacyl-ACP reductase [Sciscionella sp.]
MDAVSPDLHGKVGIVTGAGAGLGRAEALALAAAGADVVVNDVSDAVSQVVEEITALGAKAVLVTGDVAERETADALTRTAVERFGGLHVVVNNAGIAADRRLFNMSDAEWDAVIRVHLRGHFLLSRNAAAYWKELSKAEAAVVSGSVINTASEAFLLGADAQPNYAAAKAGIAALTVATARGMARFGVRANAICPRARTAMTQQVFGDAPVDGIDPLSVEHVAPFVSYLASDAAARISGQVFVVHGGMVALLAAPSIEHRFDTAAGTWTAAELASTVGGYFAERDPERNFSLPELMSLP